MNLILSTLHYDDETNQPTFAIICIFLNLIAQSDFITTYHKNNLRLAHLILFNPIFSLLTKIHYRLNSPRHRQCGKEEITLIISYNAHLSIPLLYFYHFNICFIFHGWKEGCSVSKSFLFILTISILQKLFFESFRFVIAILEPRTSHTSEWCR